VIAGRETQPRSRLRAPWPAPADGTGASLSAKALSCTEMPFAGASGLLHVRYPIAKARGFPALTFPRREDSESRASYEAALHATLARSLLIELIS